MGVEFQAVAGILCAIALLAALWFPAKPTEWYADDMRPPAAIADAPIWLRALLRAAYVAVVGGLLGACLGFFTDPRPWVGVAIGAAGASLGLVCGAVSLVELAASPRAKSARDGIVAGLGASLVASFALAAVAVQASYTGAAVLGLSPAAGLTRATEVIASWPPGQTRLLVLLGVPFGVLTFARLNRPRDPLEQFGEVLVATLLLSGFAIPFDGEVAAIGCCGGLPAVLAGVLLFALAERFEGRVLVHLSTAERDRKNP